MIPTTYPTTMIGAEERQVVVRFLSSVTGLTRWVDYIPVRRSSFVTPALHSYNLDGALSFVISNSSTEKDWIDRVPVYEDPTATVAWGTGNDGYIPYSFDVTAVRDLFNNSVQGVWFDPSDLSTLFQDAAGTTPVTGMEQPVGLMLDKRRPYASVTALPAMTCSASVTQSGNVLTFSNSPANDQASSAVGLSAFGFYRMSFTVSGTGSLVVYVGASPRVFSTGTYTLLPWYANGADFFVFRANTGGFNGTVTFQERQDFLGNHATQPTSASRPVLSARYNLLTATEDFGNAAWTKERVTVSGNSVVAPNGTLTGATLTDTSVAGEHRVFALGSVIGDAVRTRSLYAKAGTASFVSLSTGTAASGYVVFNLSTGVVETQSNAVGTIQAVGSGWYLLTAVGTTAAQAYHVINMGTTAANSTPQAAYSGIGSTIYIWGADLRITNDGINLPAYQRVNTATDYDTAGFPTYLRFDGVDDSLSTGSINFTSTDKVTVFAGVRKLSDAALGAVVELSADTNSNTGSFYVLTGPNLTSADRYSSISRGSAPAVASQVAVVGIGAAPDTAVLSSTHDIPGDLSVLRRNGAAGTSGTSDQGTGNFGNYPLFIGRRGGTSLPFNGRLYSLIVRGAASNAAQIASTEAWVNQRTKAF